MKEFVNADEIARGLSPFQPEKVSIEAGKIMLRRLQDLVSKKADFAFETTLASRSFISLIQNVQKDNYKVSLVFFWLDSVNLAIERVSIRVAEGGHNIPTETIVRRYYAGLKNFMNLYKNEVDYWMVIDSKGTTPQLIADDKKNESDNIVILEKWNLMKNK